MLIILRVFIDKLPNNLVDLASEQLFCWLAVQYIPLCLNPGLKSLSQERCVKASHLTAAWSRNVFDVRQEKCLERTYR